jgi:hypothetical protein
MNLTAAATEGSTYTITAHFSITPSTVHWRLTDVEGTVINGRGDEALGAADSVQIVLTGNDLLVPERRNVVRVVTVWGTYAGGLSFAGEVRFPLFDLVGIQ